MKILVVNGPNINMLGTREPEIYGSTTLDDINNELIEYSKTLANDIELEFFQSNHEGDIVDKIQSAQDVFDGLIINPAAYTHTSVAIHDALEIFDGVKIEVHLSHVDDREGFRRVNFVRDVCDVCFSGKHEGSYIDAINYLKDLK